MFKLSIMKMLFFSADGAEVQVVSQQFAHAGIPCEIRHGTGPRRRSNERPELELWIRNDRDCHRAFMLCVQLGIGFSKRAKSPSLEDLEAVLTDEES